MDEEIEYLSEEEIALATAPTSNAYLVYFDEAGKIDAITNEKKTETSYNFIEVEYKRVEKFLLGIEDFTSYIVSLVDKDTPVLVKKTEDAGVNTNLLVSIDVISSASTTLNVVWDSQNAQWSFYVAEDYKSQFTDLGLSAQLLFFITLKNNANFLVNYISIDMKDLLSNTKISIPWASKAEADFSNVSISTKRFFDSYGVLINE